MLKNGDVFEAIRTYEAYKHFELHKTASNKLYLAGDAIQAPGNKISVDWLPLAAEQYHISSDLLNYCIVQVPIVEASVPNRNMDEFPLEELMRFDTESGRIVYQSFIGKPACKDHDNKDVRRAKGVIFDASLQKHPTTGAYSVHILKGFDRTKDPALVDEIMSGKRNGHSMGAMVTYTKCSYPGCEATSTTGKLPCSHMEGSIGKGRVVNGHLIYERCFGVRYIESSSVGDQANYFAMQTWAK